jgi:predicted RNase H-like nuclease (RuvC/YqgF family)
MPKLVVGIDPGTRSGLAVVELISGKIRSTGTTTTKTTLIEAATKYGTPVVIATDRARPPRMVRKLASTFGARLIIPSHDLSKVEKERLTFGYRCGSRHERDALAAALAGRRRLSKLIERVMNRVKRAGREEQLEAVLELVIKKRMSVDRALKILSKT